MDMGALTAPQCTAPFKRQRSASPPSLPQGLYRAHCPGLAGRLTKAEAQMSAVEKAPWCTVPRLSSMAQHLSHLLAPNLPCSAPPRPVPSSRLSYIHTMYIKVLLQHFIFLPHTHARVCLCVCGVRSYRPMGPGASPPIQCGSLHYPLYLSICPSVRRCLHPAAHLAVLLASLPHAASSAAAAQLWVTFKGRLLHINRETAAL